LPDTVKSGFGEEAARVTTHGPVPYRQSGGVRHDRKGPNMMRKPISLGLFAAVVSAGLMLAPVAFAMDNMSKNDGMKKESMSKDGMKKHDAMSHDKMSKDSMSKDKMSKDHMKK
jgi:pentapeptide MXKDX repeat protein